MFTSVIAEPNDDRSDVIAMEGDSRAHQSKKHNKKWIDNSVLSKPPRNDNHSSIYYTKVLSKLVIYANLMRLHSPTGYLLCFFPAAYGIILAEKGKIDFKLLIIFFIGSILARSAGCIINDFLDRKFDSKVARTKERMLANKVVSVKEAMVLLSILLTTCLGILLSLGKTPIYIGIFAICMIIIYPLTKRFTNLAQVFLGATFNLGALIGYAEVTGIINTTAIILYLSTIFWTLAYDTIYAFMDIKDDKKLDLNSMAIFLENKNYRLWILAFYICFIVLFLIATHLSNLQNLFHIIHFIEIIIISSFIYYIIYTLDINSPLNLLQRFKINNYLGIFLLIILLI